jgi:DNA-binding PadR family transcriptional regulator
MPKKKMDTPAPLKTNWFYILLSLSVGEQHGYGIMQDVLNRTGGKVRLWPATLYGTLKRLIEEGLIEESEERPAPELDDARRRYYRLTRSGSQALVAERKRLEELIQALRMNRSIEVTR